MKTYCLPSIKISGTIVLFTFLLNLSLKAQESNNNSNNKSLPLFFEKIYLHTDRNLYFSGDDIWFKAYLVNAISHIPIETSANLYIDLISPDLNVLEHKLIYIDKGFGKGDIKLSDSIPQGTYKLRAYTNWMKNFGDIFLFEKEINIISNYGINTPKPLIAQLQPTVKFYPESGALIANTLNNIAFKATNENGKGCDVQGAVINNQGDTISWFNSLHNGMGSFAYIPDNDKKYFATGIINNTIPFKTELPEPLAKGYALQVNDFDTAYCFVSVITNQETLDENRDNILILNGLSHGKSVFTKQLLINEPKISLRLPKKSFKNGLIVFTLYDTLLRPHCQRLFYVNRDNQLKISVQTNKDTYTPREKTEITVKVTNANGTPVTANLSVAVTDTELSTEKTSNIISYFNLESEVKGHIENAPAYFEQTNPQRYRQLDLLLLTQGWRNFIWRRIKDTTITIKHMVEPGLSFYGRVRQKLADKPIPDVYVSLYAPEGFNGKLFGTKTNSEGKYFFEGIKFYGKQKVMLNVSNVKGKGKGWIFLDRPDEISYPAVPFYQNNDIPQLSKKLMPTTTQQNNILSKFKITDTIQLAEVTIISENIKEKKQDQQFAIDGGFVDYSFKIGPDDENMDIGSFLTQKVPGAYISGDAVDGVPVPYNRVLIRNMGNNNPPAFILDGFPYQRGNIDDENVIYNLSLSDIDRIIVSKTDIRNGGMGNYVIGIFTKPGGANRKEFYSINDKFNGYYQAREFYSPVYPDPNPVVKPDFRTTIFWGANLVTDKNGECKITYYNTDKKMPVRIEVEGLTENGHPVVTGKKYIIE